jgi:hypothetical protein
VENHYRIIGKKNNFEKKSGLEVKYRRADMFCQKVGAVTHRKKIIISQIEKIIIIKWKLCYLTSKEISGKCHKNNVVVLYTDINYSSMLYWSSRYCSWYNYCSCWYYSSRLLFICNSELEGSRASKDAQLHMQHWTDNELEGSHDNKEAYGIGFSR